jgi:hypothetical protein
LALRSTATTGTLSLPPTWCATGDVGTAVVDAVVTGTGTGTGTTGALETTRTTGRRGDHSDVNSCWAACSALVVARARDVKNEGASDIGITCAK